MPGPDGSAHMAWDYASLQCNLLFIAKETAEVRSKRYHHSQISRQSPFDTWCNMLLTGLHYSPIVSTPFLLPSNSSILPLHLPPLLLLTCTRVRGNHHHHSSILPLHLPLYFSLRARELGEIIIIIMFHMTSSMDKCLNIYLHHGLYLILLYLYIMLTDISI